MWNKNDYVLFTAWDLGWILVSPGKYMYMFDWGGGWNAWNTPGWIFFWRRTGALISGSCYPLISRDIIHFSYIYEKTKNQI